jgi:hypothetical protein
MAALDGTPYPFLQLFESPGLRSFLEQGSMHIF